jgi:hypothetical protein
MQSVDSSAKTKVDWRPWFVAKFDTNLRQGERVQKDLDGMAAISGRTFNRSV